MVDDDLSNPAQPWPEKGDSLFGDDESWVFRARIQGDKKFLAYIEGYKRAGDLIWSEIEERPASATVDFMAYPMIFLYRHYIELSLKDILFLGHFLKPELPSFPTHHKLNQLWQQARSAIEKIISYVEKTDLDAMTNLINEFDSIDRESSAFRYPTTKDGRPSLPSVGIINLANFKIGIDKIAAFLEGCRDQLDTYKNDLTSSWEP